MLWVFTEGRWKAGTSRRLNQGEDILLVSVETRSWWATVFILKEQKATFSTHPSLVHNASESLHFTSQNKKTKVTCLYHCTVLVLILFLVLELTFSNLYAEMYLQIYTTMYIRVFYQFTNILINTKHSSHLTSHLYNHLSWTCVWIRYMHRKASRAHQHPQKLNLHGWSLQNEQIHSACSSTYLHMLLQPFCIFRIWSCKSTYFLRWTPTFLYKHTLHSC